MAKQRISTNIAARLMMLAALTALTGVSVYAQTNPISPKQRIEREFRQLETALASCMYEEVLPSPEIEFMNRAIYDFMHDNPGVTRILRVNAGGYTVNDVSADSPRSAPPRNVANQRWFQHVSQGKTPYYSMDVGSDGQIVLFYGWPLTASADDETAFTGAYAAMIDLASQVALIDGAPPFRVVYQGRVVFEHDWDELDYDEEPLAVKGARDLTIRTPKPMATRLDPRQASGARTGASASVSKQTSGGNDGDGGDATRPRQKPSGNGSINKILFVILMVIALMLAYSVFGDKIARFVRAGMDARPKRGDAAEAAQSAPTSQPQQSATQQQTTPPPTLPPQPIIAKVINNSSKTEKEMREMTEKMKKMAELLRKKIDIMEHRIETLAGKIEDMEKKLKK